jgi:hypothetical protein
MWCLEHNNNNLFNFGTNEMTEKEFKLETNNYYISSGKKNAQYTLRERYEEYAAVGDGFTIYQKDRYICNLGIDLDMAKSKAFEITGVNIEVIEADELNPYGERTEAEKQHEIDVAEWKIICAEKEVEYQKKQQIIKEERAKSQYQGTVGEKITREIACIKKIYLGESIYGSQFLSIFKDRDFNVYIYFGNSIKLPKEKEPSQFVKFVVHEHKEYDGCKQTVFKMR